MNSSKLKNIIIATLLLLNALLLTVVVIDNLEEKRSEESASLSAVQVLAENGISVAEGVELRIKPPKLLTVTRDTEQERKLVTSLIGTATVEDMGGNIMFYSSENGQASLRGTGEMDMIFMSGAMRIKGSPLKTAGRLMSGAGIDMNTENAAEGGNGQTLELECMVGGYPVYNARLVFTFSDEELLMVSGTRVLDKIASETDEEVMDSLSVLMRFVEIVRSEGHICSSLRDLSAGYVMSVAISGESTLTPVWRVVTDTGEIYINAITGRVETVEA